MQNPIITSAAMKTASIVSVKPSVTAVLHAWYYFVLRICARVFAGHVFARLCPTAALTIALSARSSSFSFRETSIARDLPKSCALKSFFGSGRLEPAENASLTRSLRMIPTHTIPSCDQTAEPSGLLGRFHFTSSAISGSASWTILRSFASIAPRQSRVFATNSSTGPARVMSAAHSFVYPVSAVPAAHGADVIASRRAAIYARVASDELLACARDELGLQIQLAPRKGFSVSHKETTTSTRRHLVRTLPQVSAGASDSRINAASTHPKYKRQWVTAIEGVGHFPAAH